jgi:hypothetical protein
MARFGIGRFLGQIRPVESIKPPSASPVSCSVAGALQCDGERALGDVPAREIEGAEAQDRDIGEGIILAVACGIFIVWFVCRPRSRFPTLTRSRSIARTIF